MRFLFFLLKSFSGKNVIGFYDTSWLIIVAAAVVVVIVVGDGIFFFFCIRFAPNKPSEKRHYSLCLEASTEQYENLTS